jgi:hypothetical protein
MDRLNLTSGERFLPISYIMSEKPEHNFPDHFSKKNRPKLSHKKLREGEK